MSDTKTARKRRRKPGDLRQLRAVLWGVLLEVEAIATDPTADTAEKVRGAHALAALAGQYLKATEAAELVQRIEALEAATQEQGGDTWQGQ